MPRKILEFSEIDELFLDYKKACEKPNNDQFITTQKSRIIEELWRNLKSKSVYARIEEFPDEMVKVTNNCIRIFMEKETHQGFSSYTLASIQNRLATCMRNMSFDESTKGMHVSDKYRTVQNTLRRLYKSFISLRKSSDSEKELNEKFVEYASNYLEIDKKIVIDFLNPKKTAPLVYSEDEEDSYDISDLLGGTESFSPSSEIENREKNDIIFSLINKEWASQKEDSKSLMSELLTLVILEAIDKGFVQTSISKENFYNQLKKYDFVSKEFIDKYFSECKISLPTHEQIGDKYGLSRSGVSKKLSRFFEKIDFSEK